ncbi:MAG: response regulator [Acidobacteriota bacterium]
MPAHPKAADGSDPAPRGIRERSEAVRAKADGLLDKSVELLGRGVTLRQRIGRVEWPEVRVLNVEDHEPARFLRTRTLENAGYAVQEAGTAEQALGLVDSAPTIRAALVDVGLPDGDGFDLCEQLKARRPDLPVVMISSIYRSVSARQQGMGSGADEYLLDPLPGYRLVRTVDRLLMVSPRVRDAAVITTDAVGTILGLNVTACALLNISARGAIGRSLLAFVGADRARVAKGLELAAAGQFVQEELILRPRERKPLTVEADLDGGEAGTRTVEWSIQAI